jgi:hypothetical protein
MLARAQIGRLITNSERASQRSCLETFGRGQIARLEWRGFFMKGVEVENGMRGFGTIGPLEIGS